jgi:hypothetical protein
MNNREIKITLQKIKDEVASYTVDGKKIIITDEKAQEILDEYNKTEELRFIDFICEYISDEEII